MQGVDQMWPLTNQRMPHAPAKRTNFTELWFTDTERELGLLARPSDLFFKEKPKKKKQKQKPQTLVRHISIFQCTSHFFKHYVGQRKYNCGHLFTAQL